MTNTTKRTSTPDPAPEPTDFQRRWSKALSGAIVAELERLKALPVDVPDMRCCGAQGCPACGDEIPASLLELRARLGVREFGGATWTPPGFGADRVPATADPDLDDLPF